MSARDTALAALIAFRKQNAWSDGILKEYIYRDRLSRRDAALASKLCYGVLQNRMLLDYYIQHFLNGRIKDLQPIVLDILRLGIYQLTMLDRIPDAACVSEAVEQGKRFANHRAAGLINGLLRSAARAKSMPEPPDLATKYSHPPQLVALLEENIGKELLEPFLQSDNEAPRTAIQVNTCKITAEKAKLELQAQGVNCQVHPDMPDCIYVSGTGNLEDLTLFQTGMFYVQDPAAKLAVLAAGVQPGQQVLDACAAPGGKSFAAAIAMNNQGKVYACDIHPHKIALLEKGVSRLGLDIVHPMLQDATKFSGEWKEQMDVVIADVPCSGLGVIRKKPDIRYKDLEQIQGLPAVQTAILENVCQYVKPEGVLLYSTCTVLKRENEMVVETFLKNHPQFTLERFSVPEKMGSDNCGVLTLYPCVQQTDGFFIAKLRRAK